VHNIIVDEASRLRMNEPVDDPWFAAGDLPMIVSAGTLTERKGFGDLIRAVRALHDRGRPVRCAILGEGPLRRELEALVDELGLAGTIWLPGRVENVLKYFARADVTVLSSYSEGLPNVLVEAMMCGCVPVATDCPTGPREVLQDGKYGYLVPMHDPTRLADGIEMALDRPIAPEILAEGIRSFERDAVIRRHFELLGLGERV
jgi:glycosyltransferase involved in cell wall biosynthesis